MRKHRNDVTGMRFGKLYVVSLETINGRQKWKCQCDCGNIRFFSSIGFKTKIKSCGCLNKNKNKPPKEPIVYRKECPICLNIFETENKKTKSCSYQCSAKLRLVTHPELIDVYRENGKKSMDRLHKSGKAYIMPVGTHTQEFKDKLSARAKLPKSDETKQRIKDSHWSKDPLLKQQVVKKIEETRKISEAWNDPVWRSKQGQHLIDNPEKHKTNGYKFGKYLNKFTDKHEWFHSSFEMNFMNFLNNHPKVEYWTKNHKIRIDYTYNNKSCYYIPDFLVKFNNNPQLSILELKGYEDKDRLLAKILAATLFSEIHDYYYNIFFYTYKYDFEHFPLCRRAPISIQTSC